MPTLFGASLSPFVRKTRSFLLEKGIAYEHDPVSPFALTDEHRKITPMGKIPFFRDGELDLADSSIICAYLERTRPDPRLYPDDPAEFAKSLWYEEYADSAVVNAISPVFFNRVVKRIMKAEPDEDTIRNAIDELMPPVFSYLNEQVLGRDYLVSDGLTIADVATGAQLQGLAHCGVELDAGRWPELARYARGILERPSFSKLFAEETQDLAAI